MKYSPNSRFVLNVRLTLFFAYSIFIPQAQSNPGEPSQFPRDPGTSSRYAPSVPLSPSTSSQVASSSSLRNESTSPPPPPLTSTDKESSEKKHMCPTCSKRFSRPSSLRIHVNTHTGETPFRCPFPGCGREFNVNSNMRRHYRNHAGAGNLYSPESSDVGFDGSYSYPSSPSSPTESQPWLTRVRSPTNDSVTSPRNSVEGSDPPSVRDSRRRSQPQQK
ncbi:hypothetical protein L218DRAFT_863837 [Marasmius fiardii PR-910]|nr:hypothetical protein L218DRAFT_863837 [Marasmius fiardii PR-910]